MEQRVSCKLGYIKPLRTVNTNTQRLIDDNDDTSPKIDFLSHI